MLSRTSLLVLLPILVAGCQDSAAAVCDDGTVLRDGDCVPAALQVRLTHLDVRYDLSQPVYVNNRIPVTFGLTAESVDPANPSTRNVAVSFSFVEANPSDPSNPMGCSSSAIDVEVIGDGQEYRFDGFIWPVTECAALAANGVEVNLQVDFNGGAEAAAELESDIDAPSVVLSQANVDAPINQMCRTPQPGCVHAFDLRPTPTNAQGTLVDVRYQLRATSSVAVLPSQRTQDVDPSKPADPDPTLVVQSHFLVNGKDPYISPVDPALIPPELIAEVPTIVEDLKFGRDDAALAAINLLPGKGA